MLNLTSACFALFSPIASLNNTVRAVKMFVIFFKLQTAWCNISVAQQFIISSFVICFHNAQIIFNGVQFWTSLGRPVYHLDLFLLGHAAVIYLESALSC